MNRIYKRYHIGFWIVKITILFIFFQLPTQHENPFFWIASPTAITLHMAYFYSIYNVLFTRFFETKKYLFFIFGVGLCSILHSIGLWWVWSGFENILISTPTPYLSGFIGANFIFFSISFTWRYLNYLIAKARRNFVITNELKTAELSFLKAQINPHFLFNILGCINGLALTKSHQTAYAIENFNQLIQASSKMKSGIKIDLNDEMNFLKNYINLQKMRYSVPVDTEFPESVNINLSIEPLLILPLIEHVFKYGDVSDEGYISIKFSIKNKNITISVRNMTTRTNSETDLGKNLDILKRRLAITYPKRFELSKRQYTDNFITTLNLTLDAK